MINLDQVSSRLKNLQTLENKRLFSS